MTITAKFSTVCPCCNVRIEAGSKVNWTKGSKARHVSCPVAAPAATMTRLPPAARRWVLCGLPGCRPGCEGCDGDFEGQSQND